MSKRLRQLRQRLDRQRLSTEEEQLAWLNRASFETDGLIGPDEWVETLTALARRAAETPTAGGQRARDSSLTFASW